MRAIFLSFLLLLSFRPSWAETEMDYQYYDSQGELKLIDAVEPPLTSLWIDETSPKKLGTLLFIPAPQTGPSSPVEIDYLRQSMPKWGWQTIAILPRTIDMTFAPLSNALSEATATENESQIDTQQAEEEPLAAEDESPPTQASASDLQSSDPIVQWVSASLAMREPAFGFDVLIVQSDYAPLVVKAISQDELTIDALILINAHVRDIELQEELAVLVARLEIPVLDLISEKNLQWLSTQPQQRLQQAKKHQKLDYRQATLTGRSFGEIEQQRLSKSIYGWMHSLGWY